MFVFLSTNALLGTSGSQHFVLHMIIPPNAHTHTHTQMQANTHKPRQPHNTQKHYANYLKTAVTLRSQTLLVPLSVNEQKSCMRASNDNHTAFLLIH